MIDIMRLRTAMDAAILMGWHIEPDVTIDPIRRRCCAIGACGIVDPNIVMLDYYHFNDGLASAELMAHKMGMTDREANSFIRGFDQQSCRAEDDEVAYEIGKRLSKEYVK